MVPVCAIFLVTNGVLFLSIFLYLKPKRRGSERVMEDLVMAYNRHFKVATARFANVAFSNGSLLDGWLHR